MMSFLVRGAAWFLAFFDRPTPPRADTGWNEVPDDLMAVAEAHGVSVAVLSEAELLAVIAAARMRSERAAALHPALRGELSDESLADVLTEWAKA